MLKAVLPSTVATVALAFTVASCSPTGSRSSDSDADSSGLSANPADTARTGGKQQGISRERVERPITLTTDKTQYQAGDPLQLTLTNPTDERYSFNFCTRIIEHELNGRWTTVDESNRMCTMIAMLLEPRSSRSGETELPAAISSGRYRIVMSLLVEDGQLPPTRDVLATSAPVTIVP